MEGHPHGVDLSVSSLSTMPTPGSNLAKQAATACTPHPADPLLFHPKLQG